MDIKKYETDIQRLIDKGDLLFYDMYIRANPTEKKNLGLTDEAIKKLPYFYDKYQAWYSESLTLIEQLLPARVDDFVSYYKYKGARKLSYESYTLRDYLDGLKATLGGEVIVDSDAGIPKYKQQLEIVKSLKQRFKSSLFDIRALAEADLLDSELDAATELNKNGYTRAAGAVAGVVLESHLATVCDQHTISTGKKSPAIADFNDVLKNQGIIDTATWRKIQYLGDIRNKCDHKRPAEPSKDDITELITGVQKYVKTLF